MTHVFTFVKDNIFAPRLDVQPTAVVFFGTCGAVSDGALDYAIASGAKYVMCRTCCHDNIGGNVTVTARPNPVNRFFRFKNRVDNRAKRQARFSGECHPKLHAGALGARVRNCRLGVAD